MILPLFMRMQIVEHGRQRVNLWLPLFLVWPLVVLLLLLVLPLVLVASILYWRGGWPRRLWHGAGLVYQLCCATRGLRVQVNARQHDTVNISFW